VLKLRRGLKVDLLGLQLSIYRQLKLRRGLKVVPAEEPRPSQPHLNSEED